MPGLDYPFVFECSNCDEQTIIERADALDLHPDPDSFEAIHLTLENRGWLRGELDHMIWCPDCIPGGSDQQGDHEVTNHL
jgi:hypothetical protein